MAKKKGIPETIELEVNETLWERVFTVAPLVIIGSRELDGSYDLAPKHMAMQLGRSGFFGFVCTPRHSTLRNVEREGVFTVSYPRPTQVVLASLAATPRCEEGQKTSLEALPTFPSTRIDGRFVKDAHLYLECELERIVGGLGSESLVIGQILVAHVPERDLRRLDRDDSEVIHSSPLLAYLSPGRYAQIRTSYSFPFPKEFKR